MLWLPTGTLISFQQIFQLYNITARYLDILVSMGIVSILAFINIYGVIQNGMDRHLDHLKWYTFSWRPAENDTLLRRLARDARADNRQRGEQRGWRRQLRRQSSLLEEEEETARDEEAEGNAAANAEGNQEVGENMNLELFRVSSDEENTGNNNEADKVPSQNKRLSSVESSETQAEHLADTGADADDTSYDLDSVLGNIEQDTLTLCGGPGTEMRRVNTADLLALTQTANSETMV